MMRQDRRICRRGGELELSLPETRSALCIGGYDRSEIELDGPGSRADHCVTTRCKPVERTSDTPSPRVRNDTIAAETALWDR